MSERLQNTENVIDLVGGGALILLGLVAGVNGQAILALILVIGGAAALVYGIVRRQKISGRDSDPRPQK